MNYGGGEGKLCLKLFAQTWLIEVSGELHAPAVLTLRIRHRYPVKRAGQKQIHRQIYRYDDNYGTT